ncbi:MAG: putative amino acid permease YhdG [Gammaproteobacteria bacterium]|nr:putative amino acid permease YhdG [Gammaproteobacteria bacterium]
MNGNTLARHLGFGVLVAYGIGDILGAGIYALVGKVAGSAGTDTTLAFVVSGVLALITGLSYAELAARIPHSAGASAYTANAFRHPFVPFLVGMLVLTSGITSAATAASAFHGYLEVFVQLPGLLAALLLIAALTALNFYGIKQSARTNNVLTAIELTGLLVVIVVGMRYALTTHEPVQLARALEPDLDTAALLAGVTLAFYAFVGFEDLVNLAEEARDPTRDIPRALLIAILVSTALYLLVVAVVLWTMTPAEAAASDRPLLEVLVRAGHAVPRPLFAAVAIVAISNTALANSIMASRLLYGMARQRLLPAALARLHDTRRTPWVTVVLTGVLSLLLVASGSVTVLAQTTGAILMLVFMFVHLSAILTRRRQPAPPGRFTAPRIVPHLGVGLCVLLLTQFPIAVYQRLAVIMAASLAVFLLLRTRPSGTVAEAERE